MGGRTVADPAQFDHDRLGHLLSDRLLHVPRFQRSYAWEDLHIQEFLEDLKTARTNDEPYFMGTIVLAADPDDSTRQIIVDGQQRLTTTAVLLITIRDHLRKLGKDAQANSVDTTFLRRFELEQEDTVTRLLLNPQNLDTYDRLLMGETIEDSRDPPIRCYQMCFEHVAELAPSEHQYRELIEVVAQLEKNVQVLLAVASNIAEAYVIFETLNDRGADLTTADLLKNYLFSQSGQYLNYAEEMWVRIFSSFDKPEDLVKFIRYEYSSRQGKVTTRKLYREIQRDIGRGQRKAKTYLGRLDRSLATYLAIRDPDNSIWTQLEFDVRDSLLAYRRFGFESSMPLLLAAFETWDLQRASRLVKKVAAWSLRALFAGRLGGGVAEEVFCEAAEAVSSGGAKTQPDVFRKVRRLVPEDSEFRQAFLAFGPVSASRAKYLLACLDRQYQGAQGLNVEAMPDWSSKGVTIEHIMPQSLREQDFSTPAEYERFQSIVDQLQNLTLLEKSLNRNLEDKPFSEKTQIYQQSKFALTRDLADGGAWTFNEAEKRAQGLANLAVAAWPLG
jgi:hypothetical protein